MKDRTFARTEMLLGEAAMEKLAAARVAVFGIGGVGGFVVEGLARSGVGALDLIDSDLVEESNLNRQIIATRDAIGRAKVEVAAERVRSINPSCKVTARRMFFLPAAEGEAETDDGLDFSQFDYVVDAIDTVTGKLGLIQRAKDAGVPVISAMGAGNKLDPTAFEVADIYDTSVDPLARVMRRECKKRGIDSLKVVYSKEPPLTPGTAGGTSGGSSSGATGESTSGTSGEAASTALEAPPPGRRATPGSVAFVPSVAGLIIAGEVVKDLVE